METFDSSSVKLPVRFRVPAPIFLIPVIIALLCVSAGAVSISDGVIYNLGDFPLYYNSSSSGFGSTASSPAIYIASPNSSNLSTTSSGASGLFVGSGTASGTFSASSPNRSFFSGFSSQFRFGHLRFGYDRNSADVGFVNDMSIVSIYSINPSSSVPVYKGYSGYISNDQYTLSSGASTGNRDHCVCYAYTVNVANGSVVYDVYVAFQYDYYPIGITVGFVKPSGSTTWNPNFDRIQFEFSNTKILPPNDSVSGGSVDLSGITSQINSLSAQMTSSFQQVNSNIDSAESAISSAISEQTTELTGAIEGAADSVNDHFDDWDASLSGAFSSADAAAVVAADQAVSELHQIESDQIDDTGQALDDTGLSGYSMPADYDDGLAAIGQMFTLFFDSLSFITPLVIFSCTLGLASVLVGRKSKSDSGG